MVCTHPMDSVKVIFKNDIFMTAKPFFKSFTRACDGLSSSPLTLLDIAKLGVMFLYNDIVLLLSKLKALQKIQTMSNSEDIADSICFDLDSNLSFQESVVFFLNRELPGNPTVNNVKLALSCMKRCKNKDSWNTYANKLKDAATKLVADIVFNDRNQSLETPESYPNQSFPLGFLLAQLNELNSADDTDQHPALLLDSVSLDTKFKEIQRKCQERGRGNEFKHEYHDLVMQWISQFKSIGTEFPHSIATQTDDLVRSAVDERVPQSTPKKATSCTARRLIAVTESTTFLDGITTPPDTPLCAENDQNRRAINAPQPGQYIPTSSIKRHAKQSPPGPSSNNQLPVKKRVTEPVTRPTEAVNLCLSIANQTHDSVCSRRRVPWSLSESLALWHEVQLALPDPPSWSKICQKVFSKSRRTNVDLKDRWRVIQNNPNLQAEIRQVYGRWLDSKEHRLV